MTEASRWRPRGPALCVSDNASPMILTCIEDAASSKWPVEDAARISRPNNGLPIRDDAPERHVRGLVVSVAVRLRGDSGPLNPSRHGSNYSAASTNDGQFC